MIPGSTPGGFVGGDLHILTMDGRTFNDQTPFEQLLFLEEGKPGDPNYLKIVAYTQPAGEDASSLFAVWAFMKQENDITPRWHYVGTGSHFVSSLENNEYMLTFTKNDWSAIGNGGIDMSIDVKSGTFPQTGYWPIGVLAPPVGTPPVHLSQDLMDALNAKNAAYDESHGVHAPAGALDLPIPPMPGMPAPQCANGIDDNGDGLVDAADAGCHLDGNPANGASYDPFINAE